MAHSTPKSLEDAEAQQAALSARVSLLYGPEATEPHRTVAVMRLAFSGARVRATGALVRWSTREVLERVSVSAVASALFPFVPGLEGFREAPVYERLAARFRSAPDVYLVEGAGIAHRRRCGVACHLGLTMGRPTLAVSALLDAGLWEPPPPGLTGAYVFVRDAGGEIVGAALRAVAHRDPIFVSPGHRIGVQPALDIVQALMEGRRAPDPFWMLKEPRPRRAVRRRTGARDRHSRGIR